MTLKGSIIQSRIEKSDILSAFKLTEFLETQTPREVCAILTASNSDYRYVARKGDIFRTFDPENGERTYLVVALGGEDLQLQEQKSQQTFRLGRDEKLWDLPGALSAS